MRALGVEPNEVIEQFIIKQIHIGKQQIFELSDISWRFFAYFSSQMFCH